MKFVAVYFAKYTKYVINETYEYKCVMILITADCVTYTKYATRYKI